ncbi:MAG: DUF6174 domain-containing protein [Chloroflexota bacterium]
MLRLAWVVIVLAACTSQPTPSATLPPDATGQLGGTLGATVVATPVPSAVPTPVPITSVSVEWQEPPAYSFTLSAQCGERALIGLFHVEVENGKTVVAQGLEGYYATHPIDPRGVPTLGDLLAIAARARAQGAAAVSVELDPADGHPLSVSIDRIANAIDDEECYEVTDYQVTP